MQAWNEFIALQEIELGIETAGKWLRSIKVVSFDACNLYLEAKDSIHALWFEEHLRKKIQDKLFNNNNKKIKVHLSVANHVNQPKIKNSKRISTQVIASQQPQFQLNFDTLDPYCTFENYISSEKNILAERLLQSLSKLFLSNHSNQLGVFNPIYIHGGSGTGKTHLLMATAHALQKKGLKVLYSRAETFTENVVSAIRIGEMKTFRQAYRTSDVLIIDDIQVLSKKGATQEELFHTFNTLHLENKQMIFSANCSPLELPHIEPRLISRFEWGVVLNLFSLNVSEMFQVLKRKANSLNFDLHDKIIYFLLESFTSGAKSRIRALEALVLRTHLNGQSTLKTTTGITVPIAKKILHDLLEEEKQYRLTPEKAIQQIAEVFGIKAEDVKGKAQTRDCVFPRQLAMYICRHTLKMPFTKIGDLFSKDHSTVMTSVKVIQKGIDSNDKEILSAYHSIQKKLDTNPL